MIARHTLYENEIAPGYESAKQHRAIAGICRELRDLYALAGDYEKSAECGRDAVWHDNQARLWDAQ